MQAGPSNAAQAGPSNPAPIYDARERLDALHNTGYLRPQCFGDRIWEEAIPVGFKLSTSIKTYDGLVKPLTWLQDYLFACQLAGPNHNGATRYLPLMLTGTARQWINDLQYKSINCWFDMQIAFTKNFEGTYKCSHTIGDLQRCTQNQGESSREFLARWLDMKNSCEGVTDEMAMISFIDGLRPGSLLRHTLTRKRDKHGLTLNDMINKASSYAAADNDARTSLDASAHPEQPKRTQKRKTPQEDKTQASQAPTLR